MKTISSRDLGAQAIIVLGVSTAISILVLGPLSDRLDGVRRALSAANGLMFQSSSLSAETPKWKARTAQDQLSRDHLHTLSMPAKDSAEVQNRLMTIAAEHGVRIDRIQPRMATGAVGQSTDAANQRVAPTATIFNVIEAAGTYNALAQFVGDVQSIGLTRVTAVRMTPIIDGDQQLARATIQATHYAFAVPTVQPPSSPLSGGAK